MQSIRRFRMLVQRGSRAASPARRLTRAQAQSMVAPQTQEIGWMRVDPRFAFVVAAIAGCADDLGTCDMTAATTVVYAPDGTPYYAGQALVQVDCASGVCHSAQAVGSGRIGAPHGLNFDVQPLGAGVDNSIIGALRDGVSSVRDEAGAMWSEIAGGTMPPGKAGLRQDPDGKRNDEKFKRADGMLAGLPGLNTETGKATVRNWLACGAPIVSGVTGAPAEAMSLGEVKEPLKAMSTPDGTAPTFDTVFDAVFSQCAACHSPTGPYKDMLSIDLSSKANALGTLVSKMASANSACKTSSKKLIEPGKCKESLLYEKLSPEASCGQRMPLGAPLSDSALKTLCDWIDAGAKM
jgi:mono/diheme cytochrome c family protein